MALKGHLQHFGLGELFQTLACNRHTGTLYVSSRHEKKTIYFATGSIAFLGSGAGNVRIGDILVRLGRVTEEQIESAAKEQQGNEKMIGRILIEQGVIEQEDLQLALRTKFEEELYELLMWEEGDFEFVPDYCPPDLLEPMQRYTQVTVDPQSVIIEGLRQLDESRIIRSRLPDHRIWVERRVDELPPEAELSSTERRIWLRCADRAPVKRIQSNAPGTRFSALKVLYRFLEEDWLRTLTFAEHVAIVEEMRKSNDREGAISLFRFLRDWGVEESNNAEFLESAGRYLLEAGEKKEAIETLDRAFESFRAEGELARAWDVGRVLKSQCSHDLELLQRLWSIRQTASSRAAVELRDELLHLLRRAGQHHEAEALLAELEETEKNDPDYWILRAEIVRKIDQDERAADFLRRATTIAENNKNVTASLRAARGLLALDPDAPELRAKVEKLTVKELRARKLHKMRRVAAIGICVLVVTIGTLAIGYESQARALYQESLQLQTENAAASELELAKQRLHEIIDEYGLSSVAGESREVLSELTVRIREIHEAERAHLKEIERRETADRERRQLEARTLLADAREAEKEGRPDEARAFYDELLAGPVRTLPPDVRETILLPLSIETDPSGATVQIDGKEVGVTPYLHRFPRTQGTFTITITRDGCQTRELTHTDDGRARLEFVLDRAPLSVGALPGGLDGGVVPFRGALLTPCRDGKIYALPDTDEVTQFARRVLPGGVAGQPSARVHTLSSRIVVVGYDGVVYAVDGETWQSEWRTVFDAPLLVSTAIGDDRVAIGDERGRVHLIDAETGRSIAVSEPGFPIQEIAHRGNSLVVADRAQKLKTLDLAHLEVVIEQTLAIPVAGILPNGTPLLVDGTRPGFSTEESWPRPVTDLVERNGAMAYATQDSGWVEVTKVGMERHPTPVPAVSTPLRLGERVYLGGTDGRLHCATLDGRTVWSMAVDAPVVDLVPAEAGRILVLLANGRLMLVEGMEE